MAVPVVNPCFKNRAEKLVLAHRSVEAIDKLTDQSFVYSGVEARGLGMWLVLHGRKSLLTVAIRLSFRYILRAKASASSAFDPQVAETPMRLTVMSDYSLRVLMYLGAKPERLATIKEISLAYGISENHLMKVVHRLAQHGFVETLRGRGGGLRLGKPATR